MDGDVEMGRDVDGDRHRSRSQLVELSVEVGLDGTDISKVAVGQDATVTFSHRDRLDRRRWVPRRLAVAVGRSGRQGGRRRGRERPTIAGDNRHDGSNGAARHRGARPTGTVTEVGAVADASSGVATYPVTVTFADTSGHYNAGADATVEITYAQKPDVVQVPVFAVTTTNGTSTVMVSGNGHEETRTVTTGLTSGNMIEITSGLTAGEQVVVTFRAATLRRRRWGAAPAGTRHHAGERPAMAEPHTGSAVIELDRRRQDLRQPARSRSRRCGASTCASSTASSSPSSDRRGRASRR